MLTLTTLFSASHTCHTVKDVYQQSSCCGKTPSAPVSAYHIRETAAGADTDDVVYASPHMWRLTKEGVKRWKELNGISYAAAGSPSNGTVATMATFKDAPFTFTFFRGTAYGKPLCIVPDELSDSPSYSDMLAYYQLHWPVAAPDAASVEQHAISLTSTPRRLTHSDFVVSWNMYGNNNNVNNIFQPYGEHDVRIDFTHSVPSLGSLYTKFSLPREWTIEFDMQFTEHPPWYRVRHGNHVENSDMFGQWGFLGSPDSGIYYSAVVHPENRDFFQNKDMGFLNVIPGYQIANDGPPLPKTQWYDKMHYKLSQHIVNAQYQGVNHTFSLLSVEVNGVRKEYADHTVRIPNVNKMNPGFLTRGSPWNEPLSGYFGFQLEWSSFLITNAYVRAYDPSIDH